jgi:hypothetical protein
LGGFGVLEGDQAGLSVSFHVGHDRAGYEEAAEPIHDTHAPIISDDRHVIVSLHVATGAAAGSLTRSRPIALLLGPLVHLAGDRVPHDDIDSLGFEVGSGLAALALLAARRGPFDPAVLCGATAVAPDLEHVVPWLRPGGRKLFHREGDVHRGISTGMQFVAAGAIVGYLLGRRR